MPASILQRVLTVGPLNSGAPSTVAHGLNLLDRGLVPTSIEPTTSSPIVVVSADETNVTFRNDGQDGETASFLVQFDHTIQQASDPTVVFYWQGIGSNPPFPPVGRDLLFTSPVTISSDITFGSDIVLRFEQNGAFVVDPGVTVTIQGSVIAPLNCNIFRGTGTVTFDGSVTEVVPQWYGVIGVSPTQDTNTIQKAFDSGASQVFIPNIAPNTYDLIDVGDPGSGQTNLRIDTPNLRVRSDGARLVMTDGGRGITIALEASTEVTQLGVAGVTKFSLDLTDVTAWPLVDGSDRLFTAVAADAGNFAAGDIALILSDTGTVDTAFFFQYAEVESASAATGLITLEGRMHLPAETGLTYSIANVTSLLLDGVTLEGLILDGNQGNKNQLVFANWCRRLTIKNCQGFDNGLPPTPTSGDGIVVQYSWVTMLRDNIVERTRHGYVLAGVAEFDLLNNFVRRCFRNGIFIDKEVGWVLVRGNQIYDCVHRGMELGRLFDCNVEENICAGNGLDVPDGNSNIRLKSCRRTRIASNICRGLEQANYVDIMAFYDGPPGGTDPAFYQDADLKFQGNDTLLGETGAQFSFPGQESTTAVHNIIVTGNNFPNGYNLEFVEDSRFADNDGPPTFGSDDVFFNNARVETFADGDTTPSVGTQATVFVTANTGATTITTFDDAIKGQRMLVVFNDGNTTVDFTGTNLKGNGGADFVATADDSMVCYFDGTNWLCNTQVG